MTSIIQNLETRDGVVSFAWARNNRDAAHEWQKPWGGVGQGVDSDGMTLTEAMGLSRADIPMQKRIAGSPRNGEGKALIIPGVRSIVRCDTERALSVVNRTFEIGTPDANGHAHPYRDTFQAWLGDLRVDTMGVLGDGQQAYATVRLHDPRAVGLDGRAKVVRYLLAFDGVDGHTSRSWRLTTISPVCANTLTAAMRGKVGGTVRHKRGSSGGALESAADAIREALAQAEADDAVYLNMTRKRLTDREALAILARLYGKKDAETGAYEFKSTRSEAHALGILDIFNATDGRANGQPTGVTTEHTAWDLLQAGTYYLDRVTPPDRAADEHADAGETFTGATDEWLRREVTDSLVSYRQRLTDSLVAVADGADALALAGVA